MKFNRLNWADTENGVTFIKYLWDECQHELEKFTQEDLDTIVEIVYKRSTYKNRFALTQKLEERKNKPKEEPKEEPKKGIVA